MKRLLLLTIVSAGLFLACENGATAPRYNHWAVVNGLQGTTISFTFHGEPITLEHGERVTRTMSVSYGHISPVDIQHTSTVNSLSHPKSVRVRTYGTSHFFQSTPWYFLEVRNPRSVSFILSEDHMDDAIPNGTGYSGLGQDRRPVTEVQIPHSQHEWLYQGRRIFTSTPDFQIWLAPNWGSNVPPTVSWSISGDTMRVAVDPIQ